uniref:Integrase p58-like C-terminal domain-containing protein n=1 Tax=Amphimedon queenslandica TaxID=400682 RepID=A0A1X7VHY6_AMPQE
MVWWSSTVVPSNSHCKLYHPWIGPYQVHSKLSDLNYEIAPTHDLSKSNKIHFDWLKRCTLRIQQCSNPLSDFSITHSDHTHTIGEHINL